MKKPTKPMTMIYADAKSDFTMAIRNIARAHGLPLFLVAEITEGIAAEYKKEAMNELASDAEKYTQEMEEYHENTIRELMARPGETDVVAQDSEEE